jgi:hypothetical protein
MSSKRTPAPARTGRLQRQTTKLGDHAGILCFVARAAQTKTGHPGMWCHSYEVAERAAADLNGYVLSGSWIAAIGLWPQSDGDALAQPRAPA